jgi:hypothetical protein
LESEVKKYATFRPPWTVSPELESQRNKVVEVQDCPKNDGCWLVPSWDDMHLTKEMFSPVWIETKEPAPQVQDFSGEIDGKGVKGVMTSPKCPLELIPPIFTEGVAEVLLHGAKKYAPNNWLRGMSFETVLGGMSRHLSAIRRGEEIDSESGLPHLFHLGCGTMFMSWYLHGPNAEQYRAFDDRKFKGAPAAQLKKEAA